MFTQRLRAAQARTEARLLDVIAREGDLPLAQAMRHAVQGGKGLRGFLVLESTALHGVPPDQAEFAAAAVEAIHAYSLIHDDLPAMDDDDLRRGQPTVHIKWDEATAILAGDALQSLAFELLAGEDRVSAQRRLDLISSLARYAGLSGMVKGQAQDIAAETGPELTLQDITDLQANKTGALICWSATAGAVIAGANPAPLGRYAAALGLAFQIADDILDVEGDEEAAGKRLQKDEAAGKATFVSLLGLDGAKSRAKELVAEAESALSDYGSAAQTLRDAARFVIARKS